MMHIHYRALNLRAIHSRSGPTFLEKFNGPYQFAYMKASSTFDAVGILTHAFAKSLDGGSKAYKVAFIDFSSAFNAIPLSVFGTPCVGVLQGALISPSSISLHTDHITSLIIYDCFFIKQRAFSSYSDHIYSVGERLPSEWQTHLLFFRGDAMVSYHS